MFASIIIPAFNEAPRLCTSLPRLRTAFEGRLDFEVVVVDDGSTDATSDVALTELTGWAAARVVRLPWNRGKGGALKVGIALAGGDVMVVMDADLSAALDDVPKLMEGLDDADIAIGTRMSAGSRVTYTSASRQTISRAFNAVACSATGVLASDTQCGFKAFKGPVAKLLFHLAQTDGFALDVEVLVLAQLLGYRVVEVPIGWSEVPGSKVRPLKDAVAMLRDLYGARRRAARAARLLAIRGCERPLMVEMGSDDVVSGTDMSRAIVDLAPRPSLAGR